MADRLARIFPFTFTAGVCAAFVVLMAQTSAQTRPPTERDIDARIDDVVRSEMATQHIPGVAVGVVRRGTTVKAKGYGYANVEHDVPVDTATIFQSGSLGKQFTAAAVMLQVEDGKLALADPLTKFFPSAPPTWRSITVRHLLTHTSGIPNYTDGTFDYRRDYTEDQLTRFAFGLKPEFAAGSRWQYSNTGYVLLGIIVHKVSGRFYGDELAARVFKPLGMKSARIIDEADIVPHRAAGYRLVKGELQNQQWVAPLLNTTADGALYFSVQDLLAWDAGVRARRIVSDASWKEILQPVRLNSGKTYPYGFGWAFEERGGQSVQAHGGSWQGFKSHYARFLGDDLSVIVLANLAQANPSRISDGIAAVFNPSLARPSKEPGPTTTDVVYSGDESRQTFTAPPPQFADPDRLSKLARAFTEVDRIFEEFATRTHVPGAAWGIVIDEALAHTGSTGYRDVAAKAPAHADTVFRIASMTKSFTAMCILKLRDEGKLSLDDPAERYVPELKSLVYPTSDSPKITVRHLLSHAEGFPEDNPWGDRHLADTDAQLSDMMRGGIPFSNAPGLAYEYSNYGFAILGRIVSRVSGVPYTEYVTANILRPLGMSSTTLEPADVPSDRLARGYRWEDGRWKDEPLLANGSFGSMGGMLTTVADLSRYVAAFLSAWPPHDGPEKAPIRRASLREMQQVWRPAPGSVTRDGAGSVQLNTGGYGYGLRISQTCAFQSSVAHSGGLPGFGSQMRWLPEYGVGIIAFGNLTYTGWGRTIDAAMDALARTRGLRPRMPQPSPALVQARDTVARLIVGWDDAVAESIAADNLFLDRSKERRRAELDELHATVGACTPGSGFDNVENALRGDWTIACERGRLQVAITLAPTMPPKVQFLAVRPLTGEPQRPTTCPQ